MKTAWKPELALGHPQIDRDHQELFRRSAALGEALDCGDTAAVGPLLDFLREYVVQHFAAEEELMRDSRFPGRRVHESAHARFAREYEEVAGLVLQVGATPTVALRVRTFVEGWLERHIAGADVAVANHLQALARAAAR